MKTNEYIEWNSGNKETLVLIHGYADNANMFLPLKTIFPDKHLVSINLPMNYTTDKIYRVEDLSAYVRKITRQLKLSGYTLLGFSLGGLIAIDVASKDKGVRKIVLLNSFPYLVENKNLRAFLSKIMPKLLKKSTLKLYSVVNTNDILRKIIGGQKLTTETQNHIRNEYFSTLGTLFTCLTYNGNSQYANLNIPKTIILFEDDKVLSYKRFVGYAKKYSIKIISLKEGGHNTTDNYWNRITEVIENFL